MTKAIKVYCVFECSYYGEGWTLMEIFTTRAKANAYIKKLKKEDEQSRTSYDIIMRKLL